eukprot:2688522-Alexandrium_andersonii.AAC.1
MACATDIFLTPRNRRMDQFESSVNLFAGDIFQQPSPQYPSPLSAKHLLQKGHVKGCAGVQGLGD